MRVELDDKRRGKLRCVGSKPASPERGVKVLDKMKICYLRVWVDLLMLPLLKAQWYKDWLKPWSQFPGMSMNRFQYNNKANPFSNVSDVLAAPVPNTPSRDTRFLPLFQVYQFDSLSCISTSGENGTCMNGQDCSGKGGYIGGPCARSYGVCCVFMATCGQTTRENITYFVNQGYPKSYDDTGSCQLTVHKSRPDICQYRLDFDQFSITGPEPVNHICNNDQFIVSGGSPVPGICGYNTGNHMYVDAGFGINNPIILTFVTTGSNTARNWKVKISQIPCSASYRAEEGCLQYYTGISGTIKSFNYEPASGLQLSNQDYSICVRIERNFCGIQYTACPDPANNRSHAFTITGNTLGQNSVASSIGTQCNMDWLVIPCISNVGRINAGVSTCVDRLCGGTLNTEPTTMLATVYSTVKPFRLVYHTNNVESPTDMGNRGFCLNYVQQPCTNSLN